MEVPYFLSSIKGVFKQKTEMRKSLLAGFRIFKLEWKLHTPNHSIWGPQKLDDTDPTLQAELSIGENKIVRGL